MKKQGKVNSWLRNIQSALFPATCCLCGGSGTGDLDLCRGCRDDLPWLTTACLRCGLPLPPSQHLCGNCIRRPPPYDVLVAPFHYLPPVDRLIQGLKFNRKLRFGRMLGQLMASELAWRPEPLPELLIPVPLHRSRLSSRGFNQAVELARPISARLGIPVALDLCGRRRRTLEQSGLPGRDRRRNLQGAFSVSSTVAGRDLAIIDDVVTTGSTVSELARILLRAGAGSVRIWACARAGVR